MLSFTLRKIEGFSQRINCLLLGKLWIYHYPTEADVSPSPSVYKSVHQWKRGWEKVGEVGELWDTRWLLYFSLLSCSYIRLPDFSVPTRQILIKTELTNFLGEPPDRFVYSVSLRISKREERAKEWLIFLLLCLIDTTLCAGWLQSEIYKCKSFLTRSSLCQISFGEALTFYCVLSECNHCCI